MSVIDSNKFNISIHALREESDELLYNDKFKINISIHALREESDLYQTNLLSFYHWISIHALREESDRVKTPL